MTEKIILVDPNDQMTGTMDKMAAHRRGRLHRAFSIFIFDSDGKLLLQQRALDKYHSGGLWTNTCCGHPRPGETVLDAGTRRLMEEMGFTCDLKPLFEFSYRHEFANGLTEHEYDHVLIGFSDQFPKPEPTEVAEFRYITTNELKTELAEMPDVYTAWLRLCFDEVLSKLNLTA